MAKRKTGCIVKKPNGWLYFVARDPEGKVKWTALHTQDPDEAEKRAHVHLGAALRTGSREQWLQALVEQGEWARAQLAGADQAAAADKLSWSGLFEAWKIRTEKLTRHAGTLENYGRQVDFLGRWAAGQGIDAPQAVEAGTARAYIASRANTRAGGPRDVALFKRVWRDLGLRPVWDGMRGEVIGNREEVIGRRYRRMTVAEVRAVVRVLRVGKVSEKKGGKFVAGDYPALPDVADLVELGYYTGLRRGDVAGLTAGNVDAGGDFLRVIPEKTRGRKGQPLLVPLRKEAREIIGRLVAEVKSKREEVKGDELFPRLADAWLNKCLRLTWQRAGVKADGFGRASFHSLRATFISMMDEAGVPPHCTDAITGHAPQGMHGRYSQPGRDALMQAVEKAIVPL